MPQNGPYKGPISGKWAKSRPKNPLNGANPWPKTLKSDQIQAQKPQNRPNIGPKPSERAKFRPKALKMDQIQAQIPKNGPKSGSNDSKWAQKA